MKWKNKKRPYVSIEAFTFLNYDLDSSFKAKIPVKPKERKLSFRVKE